MTELYFNAFAREVHQNAEAHGWWDEKREASELFALMHSELSEALEEARAGRAMVWEGEGGKPEGIAVELIDAVIRYLDFVGTFIKSDSALENDISFEDAMKHCPYDLYKEQPCSFFINAMHIHLVDCFVKEVSPYFATDPEDKEKRHAHVLEIAFRGLFFAGLILNWCRENGVEDPVALMLKKHEYNKSRPYKHGKRF